MNIELIELNNKEYYVIKKIKLNNNIYYILINSIDNNDLLVQKLIVEDNNEYLSNLSTKEEFEMVMDEYLKIGGIDEI